MSGLFEKKKKKENTEIDIEEPIKTFDIYIKWNDYLEFYWNERW